MQICKKKQKNKQKKQILNTTNEDLELSESDGPLDESDE